MSYNLLCFAAEKKGVTVLPPPPARPAHQPSSPVVLKPSRASQHAGFPGTPIPSYVYFITCGYPGWGSHLSNQRSNPSQASAIPSPFRAQRSKIPSGSGPKVPAMSEGICFSFTSSFHFFSPSRITRHGTPATPHSPLPTNLFRMRTCEKSARNPCRIRTSKTKDLKPCRMNTSEKTPRGVGRYC
jgi:hypothetical protein